MSASALPTLVVGTGFGCRIQIPALRAAGFEVVGLLGADASRTAERASAHKVPQAFTDLDEAIKKTGAKAVAIATPPHTHGPLTMTAIKHGCHVLCEKPFAKDTAEARAMLAAAEKAGVKHMIGHEFRWSPSRAMMARAIADGLIGKPKYVTLNSLMPFLVGSESSMPEWWFDAGVGGGWLGAQGSHMIDQVRTWLGDFESVSAALLHMGTLGDNAAEDTYIVRFRLKNGAEGVFQQSAATLGPMVDVTRVMGTKGTVWTEGEVVKVADREGTREVPIAADLALPPVPPLGDDPRYKSGRWKMLVQVELPGYIRLCEAWRAMIDGRQPSKAVALPTFADGLACMEVLDAIRTSAAKGGELVRIK